MAKTTTDTKTESTIVRLYKSGISQENVGKKTNTSRIIVARVLRDHNVKPRSGAPKRWYSVNSNAFDDLSDEQTAYWYGFLFADGATSRSCIIVGLAKKDEKHLNKLSSFLKCEKTARPAPNNSVVISISDRPLANKLVSMGIFPHRKKSFLPFGIIPETSLRHFLRGWFDGDGCAYKYPMLSFIAHSKFLDKVQRIFIKECSAKRVTLKSPHGMWGNLVYRGVYRCKAITDYLYKDATIFLERKKKRIDNWHSPKRARQSSIWKTPHARSSQHQCNCQRYSANRKDSHVEVKRYS